MKKINFFVVLALFLSCVGMQGGQSDNALKIIRSALRWNKIVKNTTVIQCPNKKYCTVDLKEWFKSFYTRQDYSGIVAEKEVYKELTFCEQCPAKNFGCKKGSKGT